MAVAEQTPYKEYTANGVTTSFPLEFDCENQDHLIVTVNDIEPENGQWSLINGAVVFLIAPANQAKIVIQRNTPFERDTDYQSYNNSFRPSPVNKDFDRIWWKLQELWVQITLLWAALNAKVAALWLALAKEIQDRTKADLDIRAWVGVLLNNIASEGILNTLALTSVESISDLQNLVKWDGRTVYVKSYHQGLNKGGGARIYNYSRRNENDGFLCINGWVLTLEQIVDVSAGGITGVNDETQKLQAVVTGAKGRAINLEGLHVKTKGISIGSNTKIFNGTLDFSSSNIIDPDYRFYDGYIIGDNRPRSYNAEYNPNYASLPQLENIEIDNIEFVLPTNPTNAYRAVFFHKINGLKFTNNRLESSNHHTWLQVVGGHDGIDLSSVTPQTYVRKMPNGRCSNIVVSGNYMKTDWDSTKTAFYQNRLCHIVSSENIDCSYNTVINTPCAIAIDHFNRSASIHHNFYEAEKAIVNTLYQHMDGADSMAYYVGQGSYDVTVSDNYAHNYGQAGVYIEAAKAVSVKSNRLSVDSGINTNISKVGIQLQSNVYFQAGNNTNVVGNVSDSNVFDNVVYSATRAFETNGVYSNSHEKINVFGNTFSSINSLGAVTLHNIYQSTFNSNNIFSTLMVAKTDTLSVFDNTVLSSGNYALNLNADKKYSTTIKNNKFKGFNYASLISNSLSHDFVISKNLLELDQNMNLVNKTGSGNLKIIDFILNDSFSLQSESLNIAAGAITGVLLTCDVSKPEWGVDVSLIRWQGLSILASYTQEGSIVAIVQNTGSTTFSGKVYFRAKLHSMIFS